MTPRWKGMSPYTVPPTYLCTVKREGDKEGDRAREEGVRAVQRRGHGGSLDYESESEGEKEAVRQGE
jgi:hypothetical protein